MNIAIKAETVRPKDIALEGLRGLASVTVLLWHLMLGFYPEALGDMGGATSGDGVRGHLWFGFLYGLSAIILFFVLSGYVLTLKFFVSDGDTKILQRAAVKRWPRLAGPVVLSVLFSWAVLTLQLDQHAQVAPLTHSKWMASFANAGAAPTAGLDGLWDALSQGLMLTFFRGDCSFNTNIWTMHLEFVGSFLCFALAWTVYGLKPWIAAFAVIVAILLCHYSIPFLVGFPVGVGLALIRSRKPDWRVPVWCGFLMLMASIYLFGYSGLPRHDYFLVGALPEIYVHVFAAVLAIAAVELCPMINTYFSSPLSRFLGRISFPLYLVHLPLIFSLGCWVFLLTASRAYGAASVIVVSLVAAFFFASLNDWYVRRLNLLVTRAV